MKKENLILEKSFNFAIDIIALYKDLKSNNEFVLSNQILRSGTSIGANVQEATAASSRKDFINKMCIASKEARETKYWLKLLQKSQIIQYDYEDYIEKSDEIIRIITAIVKTSQTRG